MPHPMLSTRPLLAGLVLGLSLVGCPKPTSAVDSATTAKVTDGGEKLGSEIDVDDLNAIPLGGLDTPYDDSMAPPLDGDRTALDLKSLVRSTLDYDIQMDTSAIAELNEAGRDALLIHLAADPRWRVYEEEDVLVAARRVQTPRGWTVPNTGYHPGPNGPWRVMLRFGELPADHAWQTSPYVAKVPADAGRAKLQGFVPESSVYEGMVITAMRVLGPQVSLDVYETSPEDGRPRTGDALGEVPPTVSNAAMLGSRLVANGHEPMLLPTASGAGRALEIERPRQGELAWTTQVNPGEPGWVWLRLMRDGQAWEEVAVAAATRERVGFATSGTRTFLAQSRFPVPSGEAFPATAEVWFLPDRGDARVIRSTEVSVPAR